MIDKIRNWSAPQIFWSAAIAVVAWSAIGFSWFGTGFGWETQTTSKQMTKTAITETLADICVAQAQAAPNADTALKELADTSSWKRNKLVEDAKWAVMPGSEKANSGVPALCAKKLLNT